MYLVSYLLATFAAFIVLAVLERRLPGWRDPAAWLRENGPVLVL